MDTAAAARAFWDTAEARDWDAFADLLADDVVYEMPQTRERIRGREAYVRFNREYPGDWHATVVRIVPGPSSAFTWVSVESMGKGEDGSETGLSVLDFAPDGTISRVTDFWPEQYEPPAGREHLVERY